MPFPSKGCLTCKNRRIKCDETHPNCNQCIKSSRDCVGFDDSQDSKFQFKDEGLYAKGAARKPRKPKEKACRQEDGVPEYSSVTGSVEKSAESSLFPQDDQANQYFLQQIRRSLNTPLETQALCNFAKKYIDPTDTIPDNVWAYLKQSQSQWNFSDTNTMAGLAVTTIALAVFSRTQFVPAALTASKYKYSQALVRTITAISDPIQATSDELLLTVMLLSNYENIICSHQEFSYPRSFRHHDGVVALLKLRKNAMAVEKHDSILESGVRGQIIRTSVIRGIPVPKWLQNGAEFGEEGVFLGLDMCLVKVAQLRSDALNFANQLKTDSNQPDRGPLLTKAKKIVQDCQKTDRFLTDWTTILPKSWDYERYSVQQRLPWRRAEETENFLHTYQDKKVAAAWNRYRGARLVANGTMKELLKYCNSTPEGSLFLQCLDVQLNAGSTTNTLVDDICASVPFILSPQKAGKQDVACMLQNIDQPGILENIGAREAYLLVWPLTIALHITGVSERQKLWMKQQIFHVSQITGSGILELLARDSGQTLRSRSEE